MILNRRLAISFLMLALTIAPLSHAKDASKEQSGSKPAKELQGVWILESMEMSGMKREGNTLPPRFLRMKHTIKGNLMTVLRIDGKRYECQLSVDQEKEPKQIDVVSTDDKGETRTLKWIYKIVNGKLVVAEGKTSRPSSFETGPTISTRVSTFKFDKQR